MKVTVNEKELQLKEAAIGLDAVKALGCEGYPMALMAGGVVSGLA